MVNELGTFTDSLMHYTQVPSSTCDKQNKLDITSALGEVWRKVVQHHLDMYSTMASQPLSTIGARPTPSGTKRPSQPST